MIRYLLPITQLKQSTNKIYAGIHWAKRKEFKDNVFSYAAGFCRPIQSPKSYPVEIRYRFVFNSKPLDTLNCTYMAKCVEDAFRHLNILKEDNPRYVARSIIESSQAGKEIGAPLLVEQGKKANETDEDWLEIIINSL